MGQTGPEVLYISILINFPKRKTTKIELIIITPHREENQRLKNQNVIKTEDALKRWALFIQESNASKFCK